MNSHSESKHIDIATLVGILAAFGLVFYAIKLGGAFNLFLDTQSALIVLGGTLGATLVNYPLGEMARTFGLIRTAFFPQRNSVDDRISRILHYARRLRSEPLESVQREFPEETDSFFKNALELLSEKIDHLEFRKVLEIDLTFLEDRHRRGAQLFHTMGTLAPAMGLIGTLIGLVQMLSNLQDPTKIGNGMAVALITTFYGAVLANIFFLPIAGKLRSRSEEEFLIKELTIEGVAAIAEGLNPRAIERRLLGFLPPEKRISEYE